MPQVDALGQLSSIYEEAGTTIVDSLRRRKDACLYADVQSCTLSCPENDKDRRDACLQECGFSCNHIRARDLGVMFEGEPGLFNAITGIKLGITFESMFQIRRPLFELGKL